ncbi:hypothetical protein BB561_000292 [Smittium simulii]|uniref:Uncharacterized protein n=1 Tax=Smittium simulii TaxID=133385 RepID=A0A2T9YZT7_9FUNG|nr:hypothetical protein BB561_000292 [Smittium simulii]
MYQQVWAAKSYESARKVLEIRARAKDKLKISEWISDNGIGFSRNLTDLELLYPEHSSGVQKIIKIRIGCFNAALKLENSKTLAEKYLNKCPFCNKLEPETVEHYLFKCSKWADQLPGLTCSKLLGTLLGGELTFNLAGILKNTSILAVKIVLSTAQFLTATSTTRTITFKELIVAHASWTQSSNSMEILVEKVRHCAKTSFSQNYKLKHPNHIILIMGNFNIKTDAAVNPGSRADNGKIGNMIDYIMYSTITHRPLYDKILKSVDFLDHILVVAAWQLDQLVLIPPTPKIHTVKLKQAHQMFISNNRYSVLANTNLGIDEFADQTCNKTWEIAKKNDSAENYCNKKTAARRFKAATIDGPVLNVNNNLVTNLNEKAKLWANHFEQLAKDTTGNSRKCDQPTSWDKIRNSVKKQGALVSKIYNIAYIPNKLNTEIVVTVPKKGDIKYSNIHR